MCVEPRCVDRRIGVVNKLERRRVLLTTRSICRDENAEFPKSRVRDKVPEGSIVVLEIAEFAYNAV